MVSLTTTRVASGSSVWGDRKMRELFYFNSGLRAVRCSSDHSSPVALVNGFSGTRLPVEALACAVGHTRDAWPSCGMWVAKRITMTDPRSASSGKALTAFHLATVETGQDAAAGELVRARLEMIKAERKRGPTL